LKRYPTQGQLMEALKFYADPDTWFAVGLLSDPPNGDIMEDFSEMENGQWCPGRKARVTLGWEEEE